MALMQEYETDEQICQHELELYNDFFEQTKDAIVSGAAQKLDDSGKYEGKEHKISAAISKLFPGLSSSTISLALDDKYKRPYTKSEETEKQKMSSFEEFVNILDDNLQSFSKSLKSIITKINKDPKLKQDIEKTFEDELHKFHANLSDYIESLRLELFEIEDIESLINYTKQMQIDLKVLEKHTDSRQTLSAALKFGLKIQFAKSHVKTVGNKIGLSGNIMESLHKSPEHKTFFDQLSHCPVCDFDYSDYINRAEQATNNDIPIPKPKINIKCGKCGGRKFKRD